MIPPVRELSAAFAFTSRRFGGEVSVDDEDLIEALVDVRVEAQRLALTGDEVAALFYACAMKSPSLGEEFVLSAILVMLNQGRTVGRHPVGDARRFHGALLLEARDIAAGSVPFSTFCAWLAERFPPELR